ncbi:MAG: FHIPEP family type III secretion protein [Myxococcales bacterium]|nr:FHIPEP family type III secretion protein [Myxococcales bacterium]
MQQKLSRLLALTGRWLWPAQSLSRGWLLVLVGLLLTVLLLPLPALLLDGLVMVSWLLSGLVLARAVWAGTPQKLPQLPTLLLLSLLGRLGLTLALGRLALGGGGLGVVTTGVASLVTGSEVGVGVLILGALLLAEYVLLARGGERVAEVAARFVLDAMPGRQAAIDADVRQGSLGMVEAASARAALGREAELYGSLDGVLRLLRGDVLLTVLVWLGLLGGLVMQLSGAEELPLADALTRAAGLVVAVGLGTQVPVMLVTVAAVLLLLRSTTTEVGTDPEHTPAQLCILVAPSLSLSATQAAAVVSRLFAQLGLLPPPCEVVVEPQLTAQLRVLFHGAQLAQRTPGDAETAEQALTTLLKELAPELLTLDGLRAELQELSQTRPALLSEVVPKRLPLGRLLLVLRRLLAERVWPLPIAAVLETLATLPELDADPEVLVEQVRAGLGRHLVSGHLPLLTGGEVGDGLPALVLSSEVEDVLRETRVRSGGRLGLEPELRQEIIDAVLLAKSRAPLAVLLCQRDIRRQVLLLLAATPQALPVLAFSELPPQLPVRVISRIGPGAG